MKTNIKNFFTGEWHKYHKALIALIGGILTVLNALLANDPRVQAAIAVATFLGVFQVKNGA